MFDRLLQEQSVYAICRLNQVTFNAVTKLSILIILRSPLVISLIIYCLFILSGPEFQVNL